MRPALLRRAVNRTKRAINDAKLFALPHNYPGVRLTPKRLLNYWLVHWEQRRGTVRLRGYPLVLTVESTNVCNLRCPACFTGDGQTGRPKSMLPLPVYERLLSELGDRLLQIEFYNWGESLLNKNVSTMIRAAADKGISTIISSNLSFPMDDARAEEIVRSGLHILGVSLDGATQAVYEQYRVRGDIDLVFDNVRKIAAAKRRLGSATPDLIYEYHLFPHNLHEVEAARARALELGMTLMVSKGWVAGPDWDTKGEYNGDFKPEPGRCGFLWDHAVVHNDGGVAPCCATFYKEDDFGSVAAAVAARREPAVPASALATASFRDVWNNPDFQSARRMFADRPGGAGRGDLVCYDCPVTATWRRYREHVSEGRPASAFAVDEAFNGGFNYFFSRRPARTAKEDLIPLVEQPSPNGTGAPKPVPGATRE